MRNFNLLGTSCTKTGRRFPTRRTADTCGLGSAFVKQSAHLNTKTAAAHQPVLHELTLEPRGKLRRLVQLQKLIRLLRHSCSIGRGGPTRAKDRVRGARERALEAVLVAFVAHVLQAVRLLDVQARDPGLVEREVGLAG
jgi:hypothetical protein